MKLIAHRQQRISLMIGSFLCLFLTGCVKEQLKKAKTAIQKAATPEIKKEELDNPKLKVAINTFLEEKNYEDAQEFLAYFLQKYADDKEINTYKFKLADCYFNLEEYPAAKELYEHYASTYPSDSLAEHAKYKAIYAQFKQILPADLDQKNTESTIQLCKEYQYDLNNKAYRSEINTIYNACVNRLIEKEIYVYNFYLKRNSLSSARKRLDYIKTTYLTKDNNLEPQFLYLECQLAKKENKTEVLQQKLSNLEKYQESPYYMLAHALTTQEKFIF